MTHDPIDQAIGAEFLYTSFFEALTGKSILVRPDEPTFTILAATPEYIIHSGYANKLLIGKGVFEAFPANSSDPNHKGDSNLLASFRHVLQHKEPHTLPLQRYDLQADDGSFIKKFWQVSNTPVMDAAGEVAYIIHTAEDITDRVMAEEMKRQIKGMERAEALRRLYETVTNNTPDLIYVFDLNYCFTYANQALLNMWGRSWEDSIGKGLRDLDYEEWHAQMHEREIDEVVATKKNIRGTVSFPHAELGKRVYDYIFAPVLNERGEVVAIAGTTRDITDLKRAEEAVRESEGRFRLMADAIPEIIWVTDSEGKTEFFNKRWEEFSGVPYEPSTAAEVAARFIHPDDAPLVMQAFGEAIQTGRPMEVEQRNRAASGEWRWFLNRAAPYRNPHTGKIEKWFGISVDIHERKQMQQALAESEEKLRKMVMQSQTGICILSGQPLRAEMVNDAFLAISGKTREAFETLPYWEVLKEAEPFYRATLDEVFRTGKRFSVTNEPVMLVRNGREETGYLDFNYEPLKDADGITQKVTVFVVEVTEQVMARRKLEEKEKALQAALDQVQLSKEAAELGTFDMDLLNGHLHWDERCRTLFGIYHHLPVTYEKDFVLGLHPDDRERILKIIDKLFIRSVSDGNYDVEYRTVGQKDGVIRWVRAKGKVYFNSEDKPVRFIGSVLDITPQVTALQRIEKTVEERTKELAQANETLQALNKELQRSNANLEEFAHAASHDLKEPVRKIHFFTQQLKEQLSVHLAETELRTFQRIENAAQRMAHLIDDLLLYFHVSQRPHEKEDTDLNKKVQNVLEDLELDVAEKKAVVHVDNLPVVKGYPRQLQQMFQNLISNALKYSKADVPPRIRITATEDAVNGHRFRVIAVKDNGIGFEPQYADKIFQMFARLHGKAEYSGTGVGLSIVKKVVENHNGFIQVESVPDEGSVFKIYLPV
jgi:PAS domain S-box-containing protein